MLMIQGNLRDKPLVDLTLPLLFVHGSKDSMCEAATFAAVQDRMSSTDLQVSKCAVGSACCTSTSTHASFITTSMAADTIAMVLSLLCTCCVQTFNFYN